MVQSALESWEFDEIDFLFFDNVSNLTSVTEGEGKPVKYPATSNGADVAVITKIDLAGAVESNGVAANRNVQSVWPGKTVLDVWEKSAGGMEKFWSSFVSPRDTRRCYARLANS
jgi:hydrogenase nickel incorporation protein HypB